MSGTWIVITGSLIDSTQGGGFEFIGPFVSEEEAVAYRSYAAALHRGLRPKSRDNSVQFIAVELLSPGRET